MENNGENIEKEWKILDLDLDLSKKRENEVTWRCQNGHEWKEKVHIKGRDNS